MTLPPFDIAGGLPLALARGVSVAGLLSTFGMLLARETFLPPAPSRAWRVLTWFSLAAAAAGSFAWCWQVAASLADADGFAAVAATVPVLLLHTLFGHVMLLRLALLALLAAGLGWLPGWAAAGLAAVAVLTQAGHSHALAAHPWFSALLLCDALHLLAAGAWLGGLLPLLLAVRAGPPALAAHACRRFSWLGSGCVLLLAGTAATQAWTLIASLPALIGTAYGLVALLKLLLFAGLLGFAARNRWRLTPALAGPTPAIATRTMVRSIAAETGVGLLVVLSAGVLTSLPPSMHTPTVWPFALRPSLVTVQEDADFRREAVAALLALAAAASLLLVAALLRRRVRWLAAAAAAVIAGLAAPHLKLLLVAAYPTSYQHSPTGFAAAAIVRGAALFAQRCAGCHGASGNGEGAVVADLTAPHLWRHSDGELIWWLSHGIDSPEGGQVMPGFADTLALADRWALIDYVRAHNAGLMQRATGAWSPPVPAPGLQAECVDGQMLTLGDLHGHVVRLVIGDPYPRAAAAQRQGLVTIAASADPALVPTPGLCVARDVNIPAAYALLAGLTPAEVAGSQFLIDAQGWLRALQRPGAAPGWSDPDILARAVTGLRAHRLPGNNGGDPMMHMQM